MLLARSIRARVKKMEMPNGVQSLMRINLKPMGRHDSRRDLGIPVAASVVPRKSPATGGYVE